MERFAQERAQLVVTAGRRVTLKPGRDKSLRQRHPWVFSGAIASVEGEPGSGETIALHAADGTPLAVAAWSATSNIRARVWSFEPNAAIDASFLSARVHAAVRARSAMLDAEHTACRLIHGESDGLPGLVVDRYADVAVVQVLAAGAEAWRDVLVSAIRDATGCTAVYERSDADVRGLEGLESRTGAIAGTLPGSLGVVENGLIYRVDVARGQKTGFFLDQRDNRARIREIGRDRDVLDCFCYTGGFTVAALAGGARSLRAIDSSGDALALARANVDANGLDGARVEWRDADVFMELRALRNARAEFDLVILDPPKLAPTAQHAPKAARAYKDINLLALKLLRPGGLLATFSCSGGISAELFQKIVAGAALDARADAVIVGRFGASADHPVALNFPEGEYLKGLLIRKNA
jgi:23S rRNA (cytosine1962-C5)-methyltransferase